MRSIIQKIRQRLSRRNDRDENLMNLQFDFPNLFKGQEGSRDSTAEAGSEHWIAAMAQHREEMKVFMALGAVAAADERTELLRALNHARRAIDACAPYAETVEAMPAPEFRMQINDLMMRLDCVTMRRPDDRASEWSLAGGSPRLVPSPSESC